MSDMRVIWIVDGSYLMKAAPGRFDYLRLRRFLEEESGAPFYDAYYLNSTPNPPSEAQDHFHTWLKKAPPYGPQMRVKLYALKSMQVTCPSCGHTFDRTVQKGVDVGIATLIVRLAAQDQYDRLVLSTGDGDFEDAIAFAREVQHKEVWLAGFSDSISPDLQAYANRVIWLDRHMKRFAKD